MKIYTMTATCDVCGCEGAASPKTAAANWMVGSFVSHSDPRVCADNLKRKERERKEVLSMVDFVTKPNRNLQMIIIEMQIHILNIIFIPTMLGMLDMLWDLVIIHSKNTLVN